jgi:hypothetical protein
MAIVRFTQSVSLPGTNSYAWNDASNWVEGTLPAPGEDAIIDQPAGSHGVSYDNYQLSGALLNLDVPDQSPSPVLEIASGITLNAGAIFNAGTIIVDAGAELAPTSPGRWATNHLTDVAGTIALVNFLNTGTFDYTSSTADIFVTHAAPIWHGTATNAVDNFGVGDGLFLGGFVFTQSFPTYTASLSGTTLTVDGVTKNGVSKPIYQLTNFSANPDVTGLTATVVSTTNPSTGDVQKFLELSATCFLAG